MVNTKSCHFSDHNSFINYILDELSKSCICLDTMLLFFFSLSDKYDVHFDNKNRGTFKFLMNNQRVEFALIK